MVYSEPFPLLILTHQAAPGHRGGERLMTLSGPKALVRQGGLTPKHTGLSPILVLALVLPRDKGPPSSSGLPDQLCLLPLRSWPWGQGAWHAPTPGELSEGKDCPAGQEKSFPPEPVLRLRPGGGHVVGSRPWALLDRVRSRAPSCLEGPFLLFSHSFQSSPPLTTFLPPFQPP